MNLTNAKTDLASKCFDSSVVPAESMTYEGAAITGHINFIPGGSDGIHAIIEVLVSDVSSPAYNDEVVYGGNTYYVTKDAGGNIIHEGDQISWSLYLSRNEGFDFDGV